MILKQNMAEGGVSNGRSDLSSMSYEEGILTFRLQVFGFSDIGYKEGLSPTGYDVFFVISYIAKVAYLFIQHSFMNKTAHLVAQNCYSSEHSKI